MHSHLITFTGPITTTYSQIAPNLIPSPDCSPEPKVGNTGPLAQPPKYIPGASPAFLQNPRPPECPGSEQSPSPTPHPSCRSQRPGLSLPNLWWVRLVISKSCSLRPLPPSLWRNPSQASLASCMLVFQEALAGWAGEGGGVFLQRSPPIALTPASAALCCCRTQTPQRGLAEPSPSLHLAFIASPAPSSLSTSPGTHAFSPSSNGQLACRPHIHIAHTWDAPSHPQGIHLEALLFPALQSLLCDPPASWHTIRLLFTCVPSLPQDYAPEDRGPHPSVHHAVLSTEPRAWHLEDTR